MPIQDIDTRWNATHQIIERQISMRDVMEILVNSHLNILGDLYPTSTEWIKILVYIIFEFFNFKFKNLIQINFFLYF
jgi:hypothetical protein